MRKILVRLLKSINADDVGKLTSGIIERTKKKKQKESGKKVDK